MRSKLKANTCDKRNIFSIGCCKIEALISVDARGQMVLPKSIRDRAGIRAGDKLALIIWERDKKVCCISFLKAEDYSELTKELLGPMMQLLKK